MAKTRRNAVPGEGSRAADIMFIGEGPGQREDESGRPFVGPAGKFLTEMLADIGLQRGDVFITNVVKCRPPGNRDPLPQEVTACSGWLKAQIAAIGPRVLVLLGRHALQRFIPGARISAEHGQIRRFGSISVMPMYHPAAALHNPGLRGACLDDFRRLRQFLEKPPEPAESPPEPDTAPTPVQRSLF